MYNLWNGREKPLSGVRYQLSIAAVLLACASAFSLVVFLKGGPSALVKALTKSGFTAAFTLIFVSEIGDKVINSHQLVLSCLVLVEDYLTYFTSRTT